MSEYGVDQCMARLDVAYPNHFKRDGLDADFALQVYHEILDDINDDLIMAATKQWLSTARPFHPSPGELRDLALTLTERGNGEKSAEEAWLEVMDAIKHVGSYGVPQWSSATIERTIRAFGWKDLCATETDQMSYARDSFMKIYRAQMTRRHDDALMLPEVQSVIGRLAEMKRKEIEAHQ